FSVLLYENGEASTRIAGTDAGELGLQVKCSTRFPRDGDVRFEIEPEKEASFEIRFRIPDWSAGFKAKIGANTYQGKEGSWLTIQRRWKPGDVVWISFDMPAEVLPGGASYPNAVAIRRGPQVLAIDKGLNAGIDSLGAVNFVSAGPLTDAAEALPAGWDWREAFWLEAKVGNVSRKLVLVPFAEAGQKADPVEVWIAR
ncbi:MAG TPA: hypothetical protein VKU83_00455, partial [Puia sp.]|nr:hypothetical protein [Puia sp.]